MITMRTDYDVPHSIWRGIAQIARNKLGSRNKKDSAQKKQQSPNSFVISCDFQLLNSVNWCQLSQESQCGWLPGGLKRRWPWQKRSAAESAPPAAWTSLDHLGTERTRMVIEAMLQKRSGCSHGEILRNHYDILQPPRLGKFHHQLSMQLDLALLEKKSERNRTLCWRIVGRFPSWASKESGRRSRWKGALESISRQGFYPYR